MVFYMEDTKTEKGWINTALSDTEAGCDREVSIPVEITNIQSSKRKFTLTITSEFSQRDELIEWALVVSSGKDNEFSVSPNFNNEISESFEIDSKGTRKIAILIHTPKGGSKGDSVRFGIGVESEDRIHTFNGNFRISLAPVIIALKTTVGHEIQVARDLAVKSQRDKDERDQSSQTILNEVLSIMSPREVKGYIFVETMHPDRVGFIAKGIRGFKGEVRGDIAIDEISHYLTPKPAVTGIELGAFVELIDGPFKGERAKVMSIDAAKEEVTVQLVESMVPIPVTVKAEAIRMLDKN